MDVRAAFQAAFASALARAIPAGDDIDMEVSTLDSKEYCPVAEREHYRELAHQFKTTLDFLLALFAVDNAILKPTDKIVNALIDDELKKHASDEQGFTPVNMRQLAERAGIGYTTALECKKRLIKSLDLYEQKTVSYYHDSGDGKKTRTDSILLKRKERQQYPRLYSTSEPITWGGNKERKPKCPQCGSENIDIVKTVICHECHTIDHKEIYTSEAPLEFEPVNQVVETPVVVESTIVDDAIQTVATEQTAICQVGTVYIDTNIHTEVGTRPHEKPKIPVYASNTIHPEIEALCEQHGFRVGAECEKCGCPLQYELSSYTCCVRCYPPPRRGYDTYSDVIDLHYPRRRAKQAQWGKKTA